MIRLTLYTVWEIRQIWKGIPISKYSFNRINEEVVTSSFIAADALKLGLRNHLLNIFNVFMRWITNVTISIPEKSSVEISLNKGKASMEPVHS